MKSTTHILKTVERCNIDCTYCYFFNRTDTSYKFRKPYISEEVIKKWVAFANQSIVEQNIEHITIGFHGGEPLMQSKESFEWMCQYIKNNLSPVSCQFTLQTNGMLIDEDWLKIFHKYNVGVGISLDGRKEFNDRFRIDKRGRGTYDRVVEKIKLYQRSPLMKNTDGPGVLSVVNPEESGKEVI